jgi:hypothetical protein
LKAGLTFPPKIRAVFSFLVAVFLSAYSSGFGAIYSLAEVTIDEGGGDTFSTQYSQNSSVGGLFFGTSALSPSVTLGLGFIGELNEPPFVRLAELQRTPGQPLQIPLSELLENASDLEGQTITLVSVSPRSDLDVPIARQANAITYNSTSIRDAFDSLTYVVADQYGLTSLGTLIVKTGNRRDLLHVLAITFRQGTVQLSFRGVPGQIYQIQATESLSNPNWHFIGTAAAGLAGAYTFIDSTSNFPIRFYRSVSF